MKFQKLHPSIKPVIEQPAPGFTDEVLGLTHLKTGIWNDERYYYMQADAKMYPRFNKLDLARFWPHRNYRGLDQPDVVLHFKDGRLLVRSLLKDDTDSVTVCYYRKTKQRYVEVPVSIPMSELHAIYPTHRVLASAVND